MLRYSNTNFFRVADISKLEMDSDNIASPRGSSFGVLGLMNRQIDEALTIEMLFKAVILDMGWRNVQEILIKLNVPTA
ncbi:hypothetical protein CFP56_003154 [Quercus suber]|uniref:Uncharacterized protein n=1 Tax=Quercus suber TaxID=58331 RepID=A0AAW0LED9_QUESU